MRQRQLNEDISEKSHQKDAPHLCISHWQLSIDRSLRINPWGEDTVSTAMVNNGHLGSYWE